MRPREVTAETIAVVDAGDFALIELTVGRDLALACRGGALVGLLARDPLATDPLLRRFCPVLSVSGERMTVLLPEDDLPGRYLRSRQQGDPVNVLIPVGAGHRFSPSTRRLLLVGDAASAWRLVAVANAAVEQSIATTMLVTGEGDNLAPPSWLLPSEVEVIAESGDGSTMLAERLRWADEVILALEDEGLPGMRDVIARHRIGTRPIVSLSLDRPIACGTGICRGCAIAVRGEEQLACIAGGFVALERLR